MTVVAAPPAPAPPAVAASPAARRYGAYVLVLLCMTNAFNFGDRILVGVLQEPLRIEFRLSDLQLGLLGGTAFALLYTVMGLPIARYAERGNRALLIASAVGLWSAMTAFCGLAGSYVQLFLCRVGVSVGEAGCGPPAQSLISDYFPRERRARAMAAYAAGAPLGSLFVMIGAGFIAQHFGWRIAFLAFGGAGLVLALVLALTLREPRKTRTETPVIASFAEACRTLLSRRSFRLVMMAVATAGFCGFFISQYLVSFLMRTHGLPISVAAGVVGVGFGLGGAAGTYVSGMIADRWGRRNDRALAFVPAIGCVMAALIYVPALLTPSTTLAIGLLLIAPFFQDFYMGQSYAMIQSIAPDRMRATAAALLILANSLFGIGLGPPLLGALSDAFADQAMVRTGLTAAACSVKHAAAGCADARALGLQWALFTASLIFLAAAAIFVTAGRTLVADSAPATPAAV